MWSDIMRSKVQRLLERYGERINKRLKNSSSEYSGESLVNFLMNADISNEKIYVSWLIQSYLNHALNENEFNVISDILTDYDQHKNQLPPEKRNIFNFASLIDLSGSLSSLKRGRKYIDLS